MNSNWQDTGSWQALAFVIVMFVLVARLGFVAFRESLRQGRIQEATVCETTSKEQQS